MYGLAFTQSKLGLGKNVQQSRLCSFKLVNIYVMLRNVRDLILLLLCKLICIYDFLHTGAAAPSTRLASARLLLVLMVLVHRAHH